MARSYPISEESTKFLALTKDEGYQPENDLIRGEAFIFLPQLDSNQGLVAISRKR